MLYITILKVPEKDSHVVALSHISTAINERVKPEQLLLSLLYSSSKNLFNINYTSPFLGITCHFCQD